MLRSNWLSSESEVTRLPVCARSDDTAMPVIVVESAGAGSPATATYRKPWKVKCGSYTTHPFPPGEYPTTLNPPPGLAVHKSPFHVSTSQHRRVAIPTTRPRPSRDTQSRELL